MLCEKQQRKQSRSASHLSVELLRDSFYALQRQATPGIDGMRWEEYETGLEGSSWSVSGKTFETSLYSEG